LTADCNSGSYNKVIIYFEINSMRTAIRRIGNSKGVIIPAALLESCGLGEEVELTVQGRALVIEAVKRPRAGWFEGMQPESDEQDALSGPPVDEGDEEWQW
jgi:antitoxin MazE